MSSGPLVSLLLLAYKQERFIRDALESALAQTYEPLEIIVADDCSPDSTWDVIESVIKRYAGPHKVLVSRARSNEGLATNFNRACRLSSGDLLVLQGGDDLSRTDRVERLVQRWNDAGCDLVFSDVAVIDAAGRRLKDHWFEDAFDVDKIGVQNFIQNNGSGVLGCSTAVSRFLVTKYGELDPDAKAEDIVLSFRAILEKGISFLDEVLVDYRQHGENMVLGRWLNPEQSRTSSRREAAGRLGIARDLARAWKCRGLSDPVVERTLDRYMQQCLCDLACYESGRLRSAMLAVHCMLRGMSLRKTAGILRRHVLRLA